MIKKIFTMEKFREFYEVVPKQIAPGVKMLTDAKTYAEKITIAKGIIQQTGDNERIYTTLFLIILHQTGCKLCVPTNIKASGVIDAKKFLKKLEGLGDDQFIEKMSEVPTEDFMFLITNGSKYFEHVMKNKHTVLRLVMLMSQANKSIAIDKTEWITAMEPEVDHKKDSEEFIKAGLIKEMNVLVQVAKAPTKNESLKQCYKELLDSTTEFQTLLTTLGQSGKDFNEISLYIGWARETVRILSRPDYLNASGISYQLLREVSDNVTRLLNSFLD
nr:matrix-like protein [Orthomyxoviridae sp.]